MKILVSGGTGFIGSHLCTELLAGGHEVTALGTRAASAIASRPGAGYVRADTTRPGAWQEALAGQDLIVNLAGRSIFKRWTDKYKRQIYESRILTTRHLAAAMPAAAALISTSAVGYYGDCGERELNEVSANGTGFLAELSRDWEAAAMQAAVRGSRVVVTRFGIVLGRGGGALAAMQPAFNSYLGGALGSGRQWFPWIHLHDLVAALRYLIQRSDLSGVFNLCSPNPVRNEEMTRALAERLGRPAKVNVPGFLLKMVAGELGSALLASQKALPIRLLENRFEFRYPDLKSALADLIEKDDKAAGETQ